MENENLNKGSAPEKQADPPKSEKKAQPKKELSPAEMQKRKKMLIMPLFFLIFGGAMWLIFSPSSNDKEKEQQSIGFNADLPNPNEGGLIGDKRDAYQQEAMKQKEQERMRSLQDLSSMFNESMNGDANNGQVSIATTKPEYYESPAASSRSNQSATIKSSATAYQDINRQLGSFYEEPQANKTEQTIAEQRIKELEQKLAEADERKASENEQLAMMEKSYQMAAKYMPQTAQTVNTINTETAVSGSDKKVIAQPVKQVHHNVVSLLAAPISDADYVEAYSKPRNLGFMTAAGNEGITDKNSIRACVYKTTTLTTGQELQMRLLEPMRAGNILIPANTVITGSCQINGERLNITITSLQYADNIIPVELLVYDTDGQRGIFIPGSDEVKAAKEVASTLANSAGTGIMISDNAGSQLAADMGKGLIQGASQYVSKKMSVVKVTLKSNYRLLLLPKEN